MDGRKSKWLNMTPEQKAERISKMQQGRKNKVKRIDDLPHNEKLERVEFNNGKILIRKRGRPSKQTIQDTKEVNIDPSKIIQYEGKQYIKIERNEIIKVGAIQRFKDFRYLPLKNESTIGRYPCNFSDERNFYNPIN